jgi:hypothetical protein
MSRVFLAAALLTFATSAAVPQDKKGPEKKPAADEPALSVAQGAVEKADKDALTVKPRGVGGKFEKTLVLKLTGTSKVTALAPQKRAGGVVLTQRDADPKDLAPGTPVAVIYATSGADTVLLSAVVQVPAGK